MAIVSYKVDNHYNNKFDKGIVFDDPDLGINWKLPNQILKISEKDLTQPKFQTIKFE